jgi:hypothetical protein
MDKLLRILFLAAAMLALASCSLVDLAYDNAPGWVAGELEAAFHLDETQSRELDGRLTRFFAWHREQELGRYREILDVAATASADGIEAEEFLRLQDDIRAAWQRSVAMAVDSFGDLAVTLTPQQIERFDAWFRDLSREHLEYLDKSPQQREIYRVERALERLVKWFGDFDYADEKWIRERLRQLPDIYEPWLRYREARHDALLATLREAAREGVDSDRLKAVMLSPDSDHARAYEPIRTVYWQAYAEAIEDISTRASERQVRRVSTKLRDYADIAGRLSRG